jgi:hypothetical protein
MTAVVPTTVPLTDTPVTAASPPASEAYRSQAVSYDQRTDAFRQWRELLVTTLPARRGDTVLDVGCGTGLCLPLLQHGVGPTGAVVGIDASEQMLEMANRTCCRARLGQRAPGQRTGCRRTDRRRCGRRRVMRSARRDGIARGAEQRVRPPASRGRPSPRPAASSRARGCGPGGRGSRTCTHRSSATSPASTSRGGSWPNSSPICTSENWPSAPATSPSATPQASRAPPMHNRTRDDDTPVTNHPRRPGKAVAVSPRPTDRTTGRAAAAIPRP